MPFEVFCPCYRIGLGPHVALGHNGTGGPTRGDSGRPSVSQLYGNGNGMYTDGLVVCLQTCMMVSKSGLCGCCFSSSSVLLYVHTETVQTILDGEGSSTFTQLLNSQLLFLSHPPTHPRIFLLAPRGAATSKAKKPETQLHSCVYIGP